MMCSRMCSGTTVDENRLRLGNAWEEAASAVKQRGPNV